MGARNIFKVLYTTYSVNSMAKISVYSTTDKTKSIKKYLYEKELKNT